MRRTGLTLLSIMILLSLLAVKSPSLPAEASPNPPQAGQVDPALEQAVQQKFSGNQKALSQGFDFTIDTVIPSDDGNWALLWLAPVDPETGEVIATEPRLAVGQLIDLAAEQWKIVLPTDSDWSTVVSQLPADLLPEQVQKSFTEPSPDTQAVIETVFRGYKLPWASGSQKHLGGSISHYLVYHSCSEAACRYAYDFADGTMFPLLASKGGTVKMYYDGCTNGDYTCTNYLILEDQSTSPTTWQIYYHMAKGSIPSSLKSIGKPVIQGQYIGNVDDTGASSAHHLHFHVTNYLYTYTTGYGQTVPWGYSVDIRFNDVPINDGTPRTCWEAANYPSLGDECIPGDYFTSSNVGANPPTGSLSLPANGEVVTGPSLLVAGTASDDLGVTKIQVIARGMDGIWHDVGSSLASSPFSTSVDLCSGSVPDGPVDIALRIWDKEGNLAPGWPGLRTVVKNYACAPPPPVCTLTANNIILYSEPNYQGECRAYAYDTEVGIEMPIPNLSSDGQFGEDKAASVQVGANARAVLFTGINFGGRNEAFETSDPNLADNRLGSATASSLKIQPRSQRVGDPTGFIFPPKDTDINPGAGDVIFSGTESLSLTMNSIGATSFRVDLSRIEGGTPYLVTSYQNLTRPVISIGSLPAGLYQLRGWGYNSGGSNGTSTTYFTVDSTSLTSTTVMTVPYADDMQVDTGEWQATGLWNRADLTSEGDFGWRFNGYTDPNKPVNYGSLTSPAIELPAEGVSFLRFNYRVITESAYPYWDQRRVQISSDGGPFEDIQWAVDGGVPHPQQKSPLWDEGQDYWLVSSPYNLSAYAGKIIRVRFYFFTGDTLNNTGDGWEIDDVSITTDPGNRSCAEAVTNDTTATATQVSLGQTLEGVLVCPQGDVDFYKFSGTAGQLVAVDVDGPVIGSNLDPYLYLLDSNGGLIVENDDIEAAVIRDSSLTARLPYTGTYYVKVKAWDHPQAGGPDYFYTLRLRSDTTPPAASIAYPINYWIPGTIFNVTVLASDAGSGIGRVDFYWHSPDWQNGVWELLGSDLDGSDGWSLPFDLSAKGNIVNSGLFVRAFDRAGNAWGALLTGLQFDTEKPVSAVQPMQSQLNTTAVRVSWSASDSGSGLASINLQMRLNGSDWQDWLPDPTIGATERWFIGQFGQSYDFRMRARDMAGNQEDYPAGPEATVQIESACTADSFEQGGADNSMAGAVPLPLGAYQEHNLCPIEDEDWVSFPAQSGVKLLIVAGPLGGSAGVNLEVYNGSGQLLASTASADLGASAGMTWTAPESGTYYLRVTPLVEGLAGTDVRYTLWIGIGKELYLPTIGR